MPDRIEAHVDHLFRHSAGQMVATLTRIFGPAHLALAEEVVQDALVTALQQWRLHGLPDNPAGWLFQVARNRALDHVRRESSLHQKTLDIEISLRDASEILPGDSGFAHEPADDQLQMMLMCCHPAIPQEARIALTLKTVGGFSVEEIARAFLAKPEAIAQRIVRAKRLIRDQGIPMELPSRDELPARLDSLLRVLYLMFNEGYSAHGGDDLVRIDVCAEAIRLARLVAGHRVAGSPSAHALLALMLLQAARLPARVDAAGELATLEEQDRSLWNQAMIREGLHHLDRSATGDVLTALHLEAGIAASHATASAFASTDWAGVIEQYDELLRLNSSPVIALNRAIAVSMARGPQAGIDAAQAVASHTLLREYLPLSATLGELWLRNGDAVRAAEYFARALDLPGNLPEKRFLLRKLEQCRGISAHLTA
ncbi:MAG: RNA polymerase sigma factor [Thermoanaerobaculia bacterium]